jgi:general secretion pathway protein E
MSQRLVRILCDDCKRPIATDADGWQELVQPFDVPMPAQIYEAVGCRVCRDTGYVGRRGIYEVLVNSPAVQEEIVSDISTSRLRGVALAEGMQPLRVSGAQRVSRGETTVEEVLRVAPAIGD